MKLYYSSSSPFARKVRVALREQRLQPRVQEIECNPFASPPELRAVNRLSKVPALVDGDGLCLYDSPVIVEYLDSLAPAHALIPPAGPARWIALRMQALGDGLMELAVATTLEGRRPAAERSSATVARWQSQIADALAVAEEEIAANADRLVIGHVAIGAALGYLDFRQHATSWRADHPALAGWFAAFAERESMRDTLPGDSSYRL
jgi:glutathione S-transferase